MGKSMPRDNRIRSTVIFAVLMGIAATLRIPLLTERPMHCDEAVHADRFGVLLERATYEYSPADFHGPTLYYATMIAAKFQGIHRYTDLNETTLRSVTAAIGILLVGAHVLLVPYIGLPAAGTAALLTAVSPAMVYYSRFYIHEILLVFFTLCLLAACLRYAQEKRGVWAAWAGIAAGLMYATKETAIIPLGCLLAAALVTLPRMAWRGVGKRHLAVAAGIAMGLGLFLITGPSMNPRRIADSMAAFGTYLARASGAHTLHVHPWHYYLGHLLFYHAGGGPIWSEALILTLAGCGIWAAFRARATSPLPCLLAVYGLVMTGIYSLLPYKAPWNVLGFLHALILLAGLGVTFLLRRISGRTARAAAAGLLAMGIVHLSWQAWAASTRFSADPRNPWLYAQTGRDVFLIQSQLERVAAVSPGGKSLRVLIVSSENLWPLPWYFRRFPGVRWAKEVPGTVLPDVILATPDKEAAIARKLYESTPPGYREMYVNLFDQRMELRPGVELRGYIVKTIWDELQRAGA